MKIRALRETSVDVKIRQLAAMLAAARRFPDPKRDKEVENVRKRWQTVEEKDRAAHQ